MKSSVLPTAFADLEPFAAWSLSTETERNARRLTSPFVDLKAFADAMLPRIDGICAHIDSELAIGALSAPTQNLYFMLLSLAEAAPAIESYDPQAAVVDGYESARFTPVENHALRPRI